MICIPGSFTQQLEKVESQIADATGTGRLAADELVSIALVRAQLDVRRMTVAQWRQLISAAFATARSALERPHRAELPACLDKETPAETFLGNGPTTRVERTVVDHRASPCCLTG